VVRELREPARNGRHLCGAWPPWDFDGMHRGWCTRARNMTNKRTGGFHLRRVRRAPLETRRAMAGHPQLAPNSTEFGHPAPGGTPETPILWMEPPELQPCTPWEVPGALHLPLLETGGGPPHRRAPGVRAKLAKLAVLDPVAHAAMGRRLQAMRAMRTMEPPTTPTRGYPSSFSPPEAQAQLRGRLRRAGCKKREKTRVTGRSQSRPFATCTGSPGALF
jgi:hypothetical protein